MLERIRREPGERRRDRPTLVYWKNWPAAVFQTSASLPAAKSVVFAACAPLIRE